MSEDGHKLVTLFSVAIATPLLIIGWLAGWAWHWLHIAYLSGYYGLDSVHEEVQVRLMEAQTRRDAAFREMRTLLDEYNDQEH
jgi:hypothetical protein